MSQDRQEDAPESDFPCPVCLSGANYPVLTKCGHIYCYSCLKLWLSNPSVTTCAVCKEPINLTSGLTPVYAGRTEGPDPRPHGDLCREINAAREERARNRLYNANRANNVNRPNHWHWEFGARYASPLDVMFGRLFDVIGEEIRRPNGNARGNARILDEDEQEGPRNVARRPRTKCEKVIFTILYVGSIIFWLLVHLYFGKPSVHVYQFTTGGDD